MPGKQVAPASIYQLKVTLHYSKPPIWRRIQVPADIRLDKLHTVLQLVMGWWNCHLHQFIANEKDRLNMRFYGVPDPNMAFDRFEMFDERKVRLNDLLTVPKRKITYEYDFGDSWRHDLLLEKVLAPEPHTRYPRCIAGKRRCPPEDVGGVWGYATFLEALADPGHADHEMYLEWIGTEFDPEAFDLDAINAQLRQVR